MSNRDEIKYRYSVERALLLMLIGVGFVFAGAFVPIPFAFFIGLVFGLFLFFTGFGTMLKRKPQILINKENLYIGFDEKKTIPWKVIEAISIKQEKVESRTVWMLNVRVKYVKNGKQYNNHHKVNMQLVKIDPEKLKSDIGKFTSTKVFISELGQDIYV